MLLVGEYLRLTALRLPAKAGVVCGERWLDFRTLEAEANRFANALIGRGLGKGAKVAILSPNLLEYPIVHFGAAKSGSVLVHLSVRYAPEELVYVLNNAGVELLVATGELLMTVIHQRDRLPSLSHLVVIGEDGSGSDAVPFEEFLKEGAPSPPEVALDVSEPYAMTYTGGTTGFPKGVLASHKARGVNMLTALAEFGLDEEDVVAVATPLFHAAGLFVWYQPSVLLGATAVLLPRWDVAEFVDAVERNRITAVFLVPTQLNDLIQSPAFDPSRLKSLRKVGHAGAPMPVPLMRTLIEKLPQVEFTENYGQSETGPMTVRRHRHLPAKIETIGRQAVGVETRVVDPEGRPLPPGEIGEIVTRGDHLLSEYFGLPEQTAAAFKTGDGWLWTGDLGRVDDEGFITLVDRSKDIIIVGGENVYPAEVENALFGHPAVAECAVFGIPDERLGEVPAAAVVLKPGKSATAEELSEYCAGHIARHKRPRHVDFLGALPRTAIGKIQRNVLRDPYWRGRARKI